MSKVEYYDLSTPIIEGRGPQKQMHSGRMVHVLTLTPEEVEPADLAHHLACSNRWSGGTVEPFSVALHSLMVADILAKFGPRLELYGLLHDAHEAYLGDICRPVKACFDMLAPGVLARLEHTVDRAIFHRFGLSMPSEEERRQIKAADQIATATEARDLVPEAIDGEKDWRIHLPPPMPGRLLPLPWKRVRYLFGARLTDICAEITR